MQRDFDGIFKPTSIAVVGASREPGRIGHDVLKNLIDGGFGGEIYPINPNVTELLGKKCYAQLSDVDAPIDLAVFAVPPSVVSVTLPEAGRCGVKGAIIITAGYKEIGNVDLENELRAVCDANNITLIGPNCLGVISTISNMNASFATLMPKKGSVGFISQSGAICTAVLDRAETLGIGFSHFVSMGNKAQIGERALLEHFLHDSATEVIGVYLEDIAEPQELLETLKSTRRAGLTKPIIALKSGRTDVGASASASHTGALAGKDEAYDAFFAQAGIIRADSMSEFFDLIRIFANNPLPKGNRVGIITNAGGPGVLAIDAVIRAGLSAPELSNATQEALAPHMPTASNVHNPVDLLGDAPAERYRKALEIVSADSDIDMLLVLLTPQSSTQINETAQAIIDVKYASGKPVVVSFMGGETVESAVRLLTQHGVSTFTFPEEGAYALSMIERYARRVNDKEEYLFEFNDIDVQKGSELLEQAIAGGRKGIPEAEAIGILGTYGFVALESAVARNRNEAEELAQKIGKILVMKIVSDDILHKSDAGGVSLNITPEHAGEAYDALMTKVRENRPDARLDGVLLVEMAPKGGVEVILGAIKDPALGHLIMVGLGGIYVEILKDVAFGLVPIAQSDARRMINSLKTRKLLDGARGGKALDVDALVDALGRLSQFLADHPEVIEIDINPLLLLEKGEGARMLDARIIVA